MNLEDQVCSLGLAKRLKELSVKQQSLFWWLEGHNTDEYFLYPNDPFFPHEGWQEPQEDKRGGGYSAFTVAELGDIYKHLSRGDFNYISQYIPEEKRWMAWESEDGIYENGDFIYADSEANARAKMLIYLIENKLVELPV